jgi:hypothetical protein
MLFILPFQISKHFFFSMHKNWRNFTFCCTVCLFVSSIIYETEKLFTTDLTLMQLWIWPLLSCCQGAKLRSPFNTFDLKSSKLCQSGLCFSPLFHSVLLSQELSNLSCPAQSFTTPNHLPFSLRRHICRGNAAISQ